MVFEKSVSQSDEEEEKSICGGGWLMLQSPDIYIV